MDKILVAGGAGYIGSHCIRELVKHGYQPVVLDNMANGHRQAVGKIPFVKQELGDKAALAQVFAQHGPFTAVFHFAAFIEVGRSVIDPLSFYRNNVGNTIALLESMVAAQVPYFVFSSSAAVYGEPKYTPIDENHPLQPVNPYGMSKLMVENILRDCSQSYGLRFCSLRYFNAAGAHPDGEIGEAHDPESHLLPRVLQVALAMKRGEKPAPMTIFGNDYPTPDGTCVRDYIHVCDLSLAHILALQHLQQGGTSTFFNLGNGKGYTVRQVIETARQVTGQAIPTTDMPRRAGDTAILVASSEKIQKQLGWKPQYPSLQEIVAHAWNWHSHHPYGWRQ